MMFNASFLRWQTVRRR